MKKKEFVKMMTGRKDILFSALLLLVCALIGAEGNVLMAAGDVVTGAGVDTSTADSTGRTTSMPGTEGSAGNAENVEEAEGLLAQEIEQEISKFRAAEFPLGTIANEALPKIFQGSMEVKYYAIGAERDSAATTAAYAPVTSSPTAILPLSGDDRKLFMRDVLVNVRGVKGYDSTGQTIDPFRDLVLQVVGDDASGNPIFYAINGKKVNATDATTYVPAVPTNTSLFVLNNAAAESALFTDPSNYIPTSTVRYMQKQIMNIQITDFFDTAKKEVKWDRSAIWENALYEFKRKAEKNYILGVQSKRTTTDSRRNYAGQQDIYTSEGIWWQTRREFNYVPGGFKFNDLMDLTEMMLADNNGSKNAFLGVGSQLAKYIHELDYTRYKELTVNHTTRWGILMTDFESLFGQLHLVHMPILDQLKMGDCGIALDTERMVQYKKKGDYKTSIDMKVHGEESTRECYVRIDALCLKGDTHTRIVPAS